MIKIGEVAGSTRLFEGRSCEQGRDHNGNIKVASANFLNKEGQLDVSWLPQAAEKYKISANIKDYVINEIPIVTVDVPNRNLDCFPHDEVTSFSVEAGRPVYQTFIGKPTYVDHDNRDPTKARGVHFDARLQKVGNVWKIVVLAGWDKTKDYDLAMGILRRERTGFSMGSLVPYTVCSIPGCGGVSTNGKIACQHQKYGRGKGTIISPDDVVRLGKVTAEAASTSRGFLTYEVCGGAVPGDVNGEFAGSSIQYFETSCVPVPADHSAHDRWAEPFAG